MNSRNYTMDLSKGILAIAVIYYHCTRFIVGDTIFISKYLISLCSLINPLFFMMSGYFFYRSKNKVKNINKLFLIYIVYVLITYFLLYYNTSFMLYIPKIFTLGYGPGGLWFLKYLLIFQVSILLFLKGNLTNKMPYLLFLVLVFIFTINTGYINSDKLNTNDIDLQFIYFSIGIILGRIKFKAHNKRRYVLIFIFLVPFVNNLNYDAFNFRILIAVTLIFIGINSISITSNPLKFLSENTLHIYCIHYFILEIISRHHLFVGRFYFTFLFVFVMTVFIVFLMKNTIKAVKDMLTRLSSINRVLAQEGRNKI